MRISLQEAVKALSQSIPVAIPTETVWGLAAPLRDERAIKKIFLLKGRPNENPLIVHLGSQEEIFSYTPLLREEMWPLIDAFWPGGLTLVVPVDTKKVPSIVRAGLPTTGFRMPRHPLCLELLSQTGPLVAPSANRSGRPSATTMQHIEMDFGEAVPIIMTPDACQHGIESTILIWRESLWALGRKGAVSLQEIAKILGYLPQEIPGLSQPLCPGQKFRHYAPHARLVLSYEAWNEQKGDEYDGVLGFSDRFYSQAKRVITMGSSTELSQVSYYLYQALRQIDQYGLDFVFVDLSGSWSSEWSVIFDRLQRAATGL